MLLSFDALFNNPMNICVFCSASNKLDRIYQEVAFETGQLIGQRGDVLVYGGSNEGLMGKVARATQQHGGKVIGVLPTVLEHLADGEDEVIITKTLGKRKTVMEKKSAAYIALPGGIGTLDEIAGVLASKQLGIHNKPMVVVNTDDFYYFLVEHFQKICGGNFVPDAEISYDLASTPREAFEKLDAYFRR
jgi:hypothetical protein